MAALTLWTIALVIWAACWTKALIWSVRQDRTQRMLEALEHQMLHETGEVSPSVAAAASTDGEEV